MNKLTDLSNSTRLVLVAIFKIIRKALRKIAAMLGLIPFRVILRWLMQRITRYAQNGILRSIVKLIVVTGNLFFIFWIFFNGYNERFADTFGQIVRYMILMGLLGVNTVLLLRRPGRLSR